VKKRKEPSVITSQYCYIVAGIATGGIHVVHKNGKCTCGLGAKCEAVSLVKRHLTDGGQRADDPPADYWPYLPEVCPVCGNSVESEPSLLSKTHGTGWKCTVSGTLHYWQALANELIRLRGANPYEWLIPPAGDYLGVKFEEYYDGRRNAKRWYYEEEAQPSPQSV